MPANPLEYNKKGPHSFEWGLLAYLPLMDTMHHVLKAWCIILWVRF